MIGIMTSTSGFLRRVCFPLICMSIGLVAAARMPEVGAAESRPNFVMILCDDLGYGDLACFGHPTIKTPRLDRLAQEGLTLTSCYASAPVCSPSRCGFLTGRTPARYRVDDWIPDNSQAHLPREEITVAKLLKAAGYATCHVGKWHCNGKFNSPAQPQPGDHGFDYWFSTQNNALPTHRDPMNFVRNGKETGPIKGYSSQIIADEAIAWLKSRATDQPFCLFVWFHSPHEIIATPDEFTAPYRTEAKMRADYFGNVTQADHEIGRLLDTLDELQLRDSTLVAFTSDNGPETLSRYATADHSYGSPGKLRGMKLHLYEGGIRVPGIIRWPGRIQAATVSAEPVINLDVLPTLCAAAGANAPADRTLDGTDLTPLFAGKAVERKSPLFWRYDRAIGVNKFCLRDRDWKILANADRTRFELYNIVEDPAETTDLSEREPERLRALAAELKRICGQIDAERASADRSPAPD